MSLSKDIEEAIKKNLSESVATELRKYLEDAEQTKKALVVANNDLDAVKERYNKSIDERVALERKLSTFKDIENRENNLKAAEKHLALSELSLKKEEEKVKMMFSLCEIVFRNKHITYSSYENGFRGVMTSQGYRDNQPFNSNTTTTIQESGNE